MSREKETQKEMNVSGDVAGVQRRVAFDSRYRNLPCFHLNNKEFRAFVKQGKVPERVLKYCEFHNTEDVYLKNQDTKIVFNYKKVRK